MPFNLAKPPRSYDEMPPAQSAEAGCFVAGTLVHTKEGLVPIEKIKVGNWVLSYPDNVGVPEVYRESPESHYVYRLVTRTFVHDDNPLYKITAWNLANDVEETFGVTSKHPVFVKDAGWTSVENLEFGNVLFSKNFANFFLSKVQKTEERARVYNIEVDEFHTYFVGKLGVWVHNKGRELVGRVVTRRIPRQAPRQAGLDPPYTSCTNRSRSNRNCG